MAGFFFKFIYHDILALVRIGCFYTTHSIRGINLVFPYSRLSSTIGLIMSMAGLGLSWSETTSKFVIASILAITGAFMIYAQRVKGLFVGMVLLLPSLAALGMDISRLAYTPIMNYIAVGILATTGLMLIMKEDSGPVMRLIGYGLLLASAGTFIYVFITGGGL